MRFDQPAWCNGQCGGNTARWVGRHIERDADERHHGRHGPASGCMGFGRRQPPGLPPSNEVVIQLAPTTGGQPAQTYPGTDGSYSLQVAPGTYDLIITWYSNGSETGMVSGDGTITVTGNMTEDVTLPEIATLDTTVVDSNDVPVQDASVSVGEADMVPGSTQDGTPLTWSYPAQYGGTDTSGQCALTSLLGATVSVEVTPPDGRASYRARR